MVGSVPVGGDAPISVQTMTNTLTTDVSGTMAQITAAAEAGADIVRVSCPDEDSTRALKEICAESPVVSDFRDPRSRVSAPCVLCIVVVS